GPADRQRAAWLDETPLAALEDPEHHEAEADRGQRGADEIEVRRGLGPRRGGHAPAAHEGGQHAAQHPPRAHREPTAPPRWPPAPPRRGPPATAAPGTPPMIPKASARCLPLYVAATSETMAGMTRQAPMPSMSDQPMSSTARFGLNAVVSDPRP